MKQTRPFILGSTPTLEDLAQVAAGRPVAFAAASKARVKAAHRVLRKIADSGRVVYGVNTGFGELASVRISHSLERQLQRNYIRSHASGVGQPLSREQARAVTFLRANELARGHSGCRLELVELLAQLLNRGVTPVIPSRGSVGASGDLAPMAHMGLLVIGEGLAWTDDGPEPVDGGEALARAGLKPLVLQAKEGLTLNNGTQAMQAVGGLALQDALRVLDAATVAGAMSLEALRGTPVPYEHRIVGLKPHSGQIKVAARLRALLAGSHIRESHRKNDKRVQDPYSLRCIPQVHGAVRQGVEFALGILATEFRSVTDNPVVVSGRVISGGNFHGQALSLAFDTAAAALTALGNISERRTFLLTSGTELPPFLAKNPGLESGMMIPQYVAAALASENKVLAHPASADSIPTSANKEDFVSMGMAAALKLERIVDHCAQIVAIELVAAAQGVELRAPLKPGRGVAEALKRLRARVPRLNGDAILSDRLAQAKALVLSGTLS